MALPLAVERIKRKSSVPAFATVEDLIAAWKPAEPVYVLHPDAFKNAAQAFLTGFPGETMYAVKANDTAPVVDALWAAGIRHFDVASLHEVRVIRSRFPQARMSFMAPVRGNGATAEAFHVHGVRAFAIDTHFELTRLLKETGADHNVTYAHGLTVLVRLAVPSDGAALELSSKFGVDAEGGAELLQAIAAVGAKPALTFHVGSLCTDPNAYVRALKVCKQTIDKAGVRVHAIDVGGGFPAAYPGVPQPPLTAYFDAIAKARKDLRFDARIEFLCEPGRALVADGVSVLTQVNMRRPDAVFLNDGIYGSLNEYILPNWPVHYPLTVYGLSADGRTVLREGPVTPFKVFGPTCDTLDKLPVKLALPDSIRAGDWVLFGQMGAYSAALRTSFNGFYPDTFAMVTGA
jgi:ornithine decarboxylase